MNITKVHPHQQIAGLGGVTIEDFWIWAYADLLTSPIRNAFAEFMVGFTIGSLNKPRAWIAGSGLRYRGKRIEVKAAAYVQSEPQSCPSRIRFEIVTGQDPLTLTPPVAFFVFCVFTYPDFEDKNAARNALIDTANWDLYIIPAQAVSEARSMQKTVGLRWLARQMPDGPISIEALREYLNTLI